MFKQNKLRNHPQERGLRMLDDQSMANIKSSVPALQEHGLTITARFYVLLFERNPQLKNIFNMSNQARIDSGQARALADAIFAFAKYVEMPDALSAMVNRIAHKHTSLQVQPEHYPLVGEALLAAMCDVLSLPLDHPIIASWAKAYNVLAQLFIAHEQTLYRNSETQTGGWVGYRRFTVQKVVRETPTVKSFYLRPSDQLALPAFLPGQYVSVRLPGSALERLGFNHQALRQYSLSDTPSANSWRISVKAEYGEPNGVVSNYLHGEIAEGDSIELSPPSGDFVLECALPNSTKNTNPAVFISGGIGITPLLSMLKSRLERTNCGATSFLHCTLNSEYHAFKDETTSLLSQHKFNHFSVYAEDESGDHKGLLDSATLDRFLAPIKHEIHKATYYFCGPAAFMTQVKAMLLDKGVPEDALRYEVFGPTVTI